MSSKTRSIVDLIKCEMFRDLYVIQYFHEHYDKPEVVTALIEKIKSMDTIRQLRILPCLMYDLVKCSYVFQNHPVKSFERLLLELCEDNFVRFLIVPHVVTQIKWAFNAYTFARLLPEDRLEEFENIRNKMDSHSINGKEVDFSTIPEETLPEYVTQWAEEKSHRSEFIGLVNDFYTQLTNICLKLKSVLNENRKSRLQHFLKQAFARHLRRSNMHGVFFPIADQSNFLVNVIYEECFPFSTKERVPYKFVFETVNYQELAKNDLLAKFDMLSTFPKHVLEDISGEEVREQASETMTTKEAEIANKLNTFLDEARRANTLPQERFAVERPSSKSNPYIQQKQRLEKPSLKLHHSYFGQDWDQKIQVIRERSPFKQLSSYKVKSYLVKAGDDLRQEFFSMQLIKTVRDIFVEENLPLWLHPYEIIMLNRSEGFIEFLPNTMTISSLKKYGDRPLRKIYQQIFGEHEDLASTNFLNSLAGYSLVCYIFQIKDRHNGNLLIDSAGHIVHIDFSFILSKCPGNIQFQKAPFKLTQQYIDLMDGVNSDMFKQFKELLVLGFKYIRKYAQDLIKYVQVIRDKNDLPCFQYYDKGQFQGRLMLRATDDQIRKNVDKLVSDAARSYTTSNYDRFQYYTNNILK